VPDLQERQLPNGLTITDINPLETAALFHEVFVERCYLRHGITLRSGASIVDGGANIGIASMFFHCAAPDVRIIPVEPAQLPFRALVENLGRLGINATPVQASLGREAGESTYRFYPGNTLAGGTRGELPAEAAVRAYLAHAGATAKEIDAYISDAKDREESRCSVITVSDLFDRALVERVGLLKLDVEFAELDVVEGIRAEHWPLIDQIVVEVHDGVRDLQEITACLTTYGFRVVAEQEPGLQGTPLYMLYGTRA
jgi:FkbM family methyltransferase